MALIKISGKQVLVDDEDVEKLKPYSWWVSKTNYVQGSKYRGEKRIHVYIHRLIMNCPIGLQIDHLNKDTLDNRKSNLRICTRKENQYGRKSYAKSSIYIGVCKQKGKWKSQAVIPSKNKAVVFGVYESEIEAAIAYDVHVIREFGMFAKTNILPPMPQNCIIEIKHHVK